ncbi:hypothetical protein KZJ38_16625 [Paraburkholderia edwinii]|uniref:Uncharacterized protein n=1 Tax=Paraburkholderia edwinii TaxID=2861782 RepID=A0ABX8UPV1_9BURK|nr:hypothetical protein [Paraburkholderia edwinii]QYD71031.1 hypothetical protein KZJ38_16625 [Paraburkholderia edwinii]
MIRLIRILTFAVAMTGCVAAQLYGYGDRAYGYGPGYYTPGTSIGISIGGSSFNGGSVGGGVGIGVGF